MTTYRAADSKREEFRKYLEKSGVLDSLTKVLVGLYEEPDKPNNALDKYASILRGICEVLPVPSLTVASFLKQHMGASGPDTADVEALRLEVSELRQKVEALNDENGQLKLKLQQYEPTQEETAPEN